MLAYKDDYKKINQSCVSNIDCKKKHVSIKKKRKKMMSALIYMNLTRFQVYN